MTRILFIHGLESDAKGTKVVQLRAQGFDVHAVDMHMSVWSLQRRNSVLRSVLRMPEPWFVLGLSMALWCGVTVSWWLPVAGLAVLGTWAWARLYTLFRTGMVHSLEACLAIQADAIATARPEVVVGSSWGGAVTTHLLARGLWHGPTILLAPATTKVSDWTRRHDDLGTFEQVRARCRDIPVEVFHDPSDDVVPYADSERMAEHTDIVLHTVDAGGHRLLGLLERGELATAIRRLAARAA